MAPDKKAQWKRVQEKLSLADYAEIYVPEVELLSEAKASPFGPSLADTLHGCVVRELQKKYPVTIDPLEGTSGEKRATLQLALSEIRPGNGFVRWLFGLGIAPTVLQVEGRVIELGQDEPALQFVRRRSFDGYPTAGLNVSVLSAKATHKVSIGEMARDITLFLAHAR